MLNHVTMLIGGGVWGLNSWCGVVYVYVNLQLKINDDTNRAKTERGYFAICTVANYCKRKNGGHVVCNYC